MSYRRVSPIVRFAVGLGFTVGIFGLLASARADEAQPPEDRVVTKLFDEPDFVVRAVYDQRATFGDVEWLRIEIENKTDAPVKVLAFQCGARAVAYRLDDGTRHPSDRISHYFIGPSAAMLIEGAEHTTGGPWEVPLPAKATRRDPACMCSWVSMLLSYPPSSGIRVEGTWLAEIWLAGGRKLKLKEGERNFQFEMRPPDAAQLAALNELTRRILRNDRPHHHNTQLCWRLLSDPRTSSTVTVDDVVAAMRVARSKWRFTNDVERFAAQRFAGKPEIIEAVRESIRAKHRDIYYDLQKNPALWHASYVRDLISACSPYTPQQRDALRLLHMHDDDWKDDWQLSLLLSMEVKSYWRKTLNQSLPNLQEHSLGSWAEAVDDLSYTGDVNLIPLIALGLDDKRRLPLDSNTNGVVVARFLTPLRVCDASLDSILRLLDGPVQPIYDRLGLYDEEGTRDDLDTVSKRFDAARDKMIADLKKRLAAREKDEKR